MHSPRIVRNLTKAYANHANFITNLPKPTMVPTTLNLMNHSAISFLPGVISNLSTDAIPAEPTLACPTEEFPSQISKPTGDPLDGNTV